MVRSAQVGNMLVRELLAFETVRFQIIEHGGGLYQVGGL